jgi:hypothetical protein
MTPPTRFLAIGRTITRQGGKFVLRVVARPAAATLQPSEACRGCWFDSTACIHRLACSKFDRKDGVSVWFVANKK